MRNFFRWVGQTVRDALKPHGGQRAMRNLEIGADRLIDRAIERFPVLGSIDRLESPAAKAEPDLLRETVSDMGGTEWIHKIAEQAQRVKPGNHSGPHRRGH